MVTRKRSYQRYIIAGIITALVFALGVLLGQIIDNARVQDLNAKASIQEMDYKSLQLHYLYLSDMENSPEGCLLIRASMKDSISELAYSLDQYERYEQDTTINEQEYQRVAREYLLDNIRYWIFSKRTKKICGEDIINVLYFYSKNNCEICSNQGVILSYFKTKLQDQILIFPINIDLEKNEDFIKLLRVQYNITTLPTIIVDDEKFEGVVSRQNLSRIICEKSINKERCLT